MAKSTAKRDKKRHHRCPFTVVIDSNETLAYRFDDLRSDDGGTIAVPTVKKPLYNMHRRPYESERGNVLERGLADYSIDGHELDIQIERKSFQDLCGSLGADRESFEVRMMRLNDDDIGCAYLVIECDWSYTHHAPYRGDMNARKISRAWQSWTQKYPKVHWMWAVNREFAEALTFRLLATWWRHNMDPKWRV